MDDAAIVAVQKKHLNYQIAELCTRPDLRFAWVRVFDLYSESKTHFCFSMQRQYTDHWLNLFSDCYDDPPPVLHPGGTPYCNMWRKFRNVVVAQVRREITIFSRFDDIVEGAKHYLKDCRHCGIRADKWTEKVQRHISVGERMTPLTTFLS